MASIQWEPENSGIGRRLLDSKYDFKKSNEHETQHICSVNRPISLIKWLNKLLVKLFALLQHEIHLTIALMALKSFE